jgi:hypothetical protein
MEFRWIAIITLWTLLAGPIFDAKVHWSKSRQSEVSASPRAKK